MRLSPNGDYGGEGLVEGVSGPILGSLNIDTAREDFQRAYVHAVIAAARCSHITRCRTTRE